MAIEIPPKFVDLWTASTRIGSEVNVIGVVSDFLPARKSSGTDWTVTFSIADRSYGSVGEIGQDGLKARFFKKMQSELPQIWGTGDVVVLHNMKIKQYNGVTLAMSSYGSTWTVLHASSIPDKVPPNLVMIPHEKETRAPPIASSEVKYIIDVCNYFDRSSFTSKEASTAVSPSRTQTVTPTTAIAPRQKFSLIKDAQIATFYDLVGQVVKIFPSNGRTDLYITDYTPNQLLYFYEWGQGEDGLDARDGDDFGYISRASKNTKKWPGPFGKLTLAVTLWSPHSEYAQQHVKEGAFVFLRNTHIRLDQDSKMVGSLHSDRRYADRIDITVLTDFHNDDRVKDVLRRKKDYHKKFDQQSEKYVIEARETRRTASKDANATQEGDLTSMSRKQSKQQRKKHKKVQLAQSKPTDEVSAKRKRSDNVENEPPLCSSEIAALHTAVTSPPPRKARRLDVNIGTNENIKCSHHLTPITPLTTILSLDGHVNKTPKGEVYTLPFQNINSRASVRVIDFWPSHLADFAVPRRKRSEYAVLSDYEDSDSESDSESESVNGSKGEEEEDAMLQHPREPTTTTPWRRRPKKKNKAISNEEEEEEAESDNNDGRECEWEWRFALLLEDATAAAPQSSSSSSSSPKPTLKAYVYGPDAECLLKLDAENLHASPTALAALREKMFLLWGDLEERKMKMEMKMKKMMMRKTQQQQQQQQSDANANSNANAHALREIEDNEQDTTGRQNTRESKSKKGKPFQCCLKEYGVKVGRRRRGEDDDNNNDDNVEIEIETGEEGDGSGGGGSSSSSRGRRRRIGGGDGMRSVSMQDGDPRLWERRWRMWGCTIT